MNDFQFNGEFLGVKVDRCPFCETTEAFINWIPETHHKYAVTTFGHIVSYCRKEPFVMSTVGKHEYARARLGPRVNCVVVQKIVAIVFPRWIPQWDGSAIDWKRSEIDHHDKNKKHNCVSNLRVVPKGSQVKLNYEKGERTQKVMPSDVEEIVRLRRQGTHVKAIANRYKISTTRVYQLTTS